MLTCTAVLMIKLILYVCHSPPSAMWLLSATKMNPIAMVTAIKVWSLKTYFFCYWNTFGGFIVSFNHFPQCLPPFSANNTRYACDFENAVHCGISQTTNDKGEFLMTNGSYLKNKVLYEDAFNEHTNNDSNGML